jgi:hypothetical protein
MANAEVARSAVAARSALVLARESDSESEAQELPVSTDFVAIVTAAPTRPRTARRVGLGRRPRSLTAALVRVLACTLEGSAAGSGRSQELRLRKASIAASAAILSSMPATDEPPDTDALTLGRSFTLSALVTFPAATAFILGVIYAVGAVTRSAELSRAGVPVTVAFPLIPISQELARGIQIFVSPGVLILVLILAASLVLFDVFNRFPGRVRADRQAGEGR